MFNRSMCLMSVSIQIMFLHKIKKIKNIYDIYCTGYWKVRSQSDSTLLT